MTWRSVVDPRLSTRRERRSSQRRCGRQASAHCTPVKDCGPEMPASSARWKQQVSPSQGRLTRPPILWGDKVRARNGFPGSSDSVIPRDGVIASTQRAIMDFVLLGCANGSSLRRFRM